MLKIQRRIIEKLENIVDIAERSLDKKYEMEVMINQFCLNL